MASNSENQGTISSTFNFGEPVVASTSEKVDQDTTPSTFKLGDLVLARLKTKGFFGGDEIVWISVICPDFCTSDKYTEEKDLLFAGLTRFYHVQRLGWKFEQAWLADHQLEIIKHDSVQDMMVTIPYVIVQNEVAWKYCQRFVNKTNKELVDFCRIRAESFYSFKNSPYAIDDHVEELQKLNQIIKDLKKDNVKLSNENVKLSKENVALLHEFKEFVTSQNQDKRQNEQLKNEFKSLKDSFEELKNSLTSQNHDLPKNERKTESNNENAKEMEFENVEDFVEEFLKLKQFIKDLKIDNSKLSKENENYEKVQKQNEALIKNLKEDNMKLHKEVGVLKYGC